VARKDDPPLESEKTVRLRLMNLLRAESIDARNRIKKTAATIGVEERRRGTTRHTHATAVLHRHARSLRQRQPSLRRR
jgi:hypothetical protein